MTTATSPRWPIDCGRIGRPTARADKLVLSFHGIPERSLLRGDPYHCQCHVTARPADASGWGLTPDDVRVTFQSRFGKGQVAAALHRTPRCVRWPGKA